MSNTRFGGLILRSGASSKWFADLPQAVAGPDYVVTWDDFDKVAINATNDWTVVKDSGAAVALVADTAGGEVALTSTTTTENDGASIQGNETFLPAAGRTIWFETRVKNGDADEIDLFVGMCQNFATDPEAALAASNRIGFQVNDGAADILCKTEVADTETSTDSGVDLADAAYIRLGFKVNGIANVEFYVNRQLVAVHTTVPATELALAAFSLSGKATGTVVTTLDYILGVATR
jgi:hypothetical protein